jgi:aspartate-semialdehyde dehydrogenase
MNSLKKQQGMTGTSIVIMLIGICTAVLLVLKIVPVYMEHGKVVSALESLKNYSGIGEQSKREVEKILSARFDVNSIRNPIIDDAVEVTKVGNYLKVQIAYDIEVPLVSNLYALMKFDDSIEVGNTE